MNQLVLVFILAALCMIGALSIDAYLPALQAIALHFGVSLAVAQQSLTVYLVAFATMTLFYGALSDSFGRRPVILCALTVYLVGTMGAGCSSTLGWLIFFRLLQGLSAGAGGLIGRAIIGDLFVGAEAERMMSYVTMFWGLAPAIAPILGGCLEAWFGWRSIFLFIAIFTLLLLLACLRALPESLPRSERHAFHFTIIGANYWHVVRHGRFFLQAIGLGLSFSGIMIYISSAPAFVLHILHLRETDFAWLFVPIIGGITLGSMAAARISHHLPGSSVIRIGFLIMMLGVTANVAYCWLLPPQLPWIVLPIALFSFGAALVNPAMTVQALSLLPRVRGLASSLQTFYFMMIFSLASGIVAPLLFGSALKLALGTAAGAMLSLVAWTLGTRHSIPQKSPLTVPA